jgi:hypothetical protein
MYFCSGGFNIKFDEKSGPIYQAQISEIVKGPVICSSSLLGLTSDQSDGLLLAVFGREAAL